MIGYAMLGTNQYDKALAFYDTVLAPVGGKRMMDFGVSTVFGTDMGGAMLGVGQPYNKEAATWGNGTMIALQMPSKEKVHEVYDAALKAGGSDEGPAGACPAGLSPTARLPELVRRERRLSSDGPAGRLP